MNHIEITKIPNSPTEVFWFALKELIKHNLGEMILVCGSVVFLLLSMWFVVFLPYLMLFYQPTLFGSIAYLFHYAQTETVGRTLIYSWRAILIFVARRLILGLFLSIWVVFCVATDLPIFQFDVFGFKSGLILITLFTPIIIEVVLPLFTQKRPILNRSMLCSRYFFKSYLIVKGKYPEIDKQDTDLQFGLKNQNIKDFLEMREKNKAHYRFYYGLCYISALLAFIGIRLVEHNILLCSLLVAISLIIPHYYHYTLCELAINQKQLTKTVPLRIAQMRLS